MFDIPNAKRVRRGDLLVGSRSPSPVLSSSADPDLQKAFRDQLAALYGPIPDYNVEVEIPKVDGQEDNPANTKEDAEFDFRLFFSMPQSKDTSDTTGQGPHIDRIILLHSDGSSEVGNGDGGEGRFLRPRPRSYYFSTPKNDVQRQEYKDAALDGQQILELAKRRAWGLEVPWRVQTIRDVTLKVANAQTTRQTVLHDEDDSQNRKAKPGKKKRILIREKRRKREALEDGKKKLAEAKEIAEREKKTRRNREKKVKRKLKEKAKKAGVAGATDADLIRSDDGGERSDMDER